MSDFLFFIACSACATSGYLLGAGMRNSAFSSQPWKFLRWDDNSLGYRPVSEDYNPKPNDRMLMALEVDTSDPEEVKVKYN